MKTECDRKMLGTDVRVAVLDRLLARQGHNLARIRVEVIETGLALREVVEIGDGRVTLKAVGRHVDVTRADTPASWVSDRPSRDLPLPEDRFDRADQGRTDGSAGETADQRDDRHRAEIHAAT